MDMAREIAEALQHMRCGRARRVPIDVLGLQPAGSCSTDPDAPPVLYGLTRNAKSPESEDPGYTGIAAFYWNLL